MQIKQYKYILCGYKKQFTGFKETFPKLTFYTKEQTQMLYREKVKITNFKVLQKFGRGSIVDVFQEEIRFLVTNTGVTTCNTLGLRCLSLVALGRIQKSSEEKAIKA